MTSVTITIPTRSSITASGLSGGSYDERWEKTEFFCPGCGHRNVWVSTTGGDYYVGETHICLDCKSSFYLPSDVEPITPESIDAARLAALIKSTTP